METICIEDELSQAIWWWIRLTSQEDIIYTTNTSNLVDKVRLDNLFRFWLEVEELTKKKVLKILYDDNNIQILNNSWKLQIPWFYKNPEKHKILSKIWIYEYFKKYNIIDYLPKSYFISSDKKDKIDEILKVIRSKFSQEDKIVLKHPLLDGNWNWVWIINNYSSKNKLKKSIEESLSKFRKKWWNLNSELLIQEFVENKIWEWSITFSIQNYRIENWGLVHNYTDNWWYFSSDNFFWFLSLEEKLKLEKQIETDLRNLLEWLNKEWIRGNIWFDLIFSKENNQIKVFIIEANWIHRTTWSTLPNNFAYNTWNEKFLWIPIAKRFIKEKYQDFSERSLLEIANILKSFWKSFWQEQIMNIKCEGQEWWYPVLWLSAAWENPDNLVELYLKLDIFNENWIRYLKEIFNKII